MQHIDLCQIISRLLFILPNTIQLNFQLLYRIFDSLKSQAIAEFDRQDVVNQIDNKRHINLELSIRILLQCRNQITVDEVISSWSSVDDKIDKIDVKSDEEKDAETYTQTEEEDGEEEEGIESQVISSDEI